MQRITPLLLSAMVFMTTGASSSVSVASRVRGAVLGGLVGDALALAYHYEYDAKVIAKRGRQRDFLAPQINYGVGWGRANYHPGKAAGDMTDAGDVSVMLLDYLVARNGGAYDFDGFATHWLEEIQPPVGSGRVGYGSCNFQTVGRDFSGPCPAGMRPGYINAATRRTLEVIASAPGRKGQQRKQQSAGSNCLFPATHFAPLLALPYTTEAAFVQDAVSTAFLSHNHPEPTEATSFLARAVYKLVAAQGASSSDLEKVLTDSAAALGSRFIQARLSDAIMKVAEAKDTTSQLFGLGDFADDAAITSMARLWDVGRSEPIKVGKASPTEGALPAALYFALKYQTSLEEALVANAACGGDSGARAVVIGSLLGAVHGEEAVPERWRSGLRSYARVDKALTTLLHARTKAMQADDQRNAEL
jgi:ADP-ribosylglycohydrolase